MIKYKGIIYEKVFKQLKNVELRVNVLSCGSYCDYHALHLGILFQANLISLYDIICDRASSIYAQDVSGKNWELVITGTGVKGQGRRFLELMLGPIIDGVATRAVILGKMSMTVKGNWGKNWQGVFCEFRKLRGFSADKVVEVEVGRLIPRHLLDMMELEGIDGFLGMPPWFF